ncbi:MAG: biotin--[acetyl-CoA-carboxylase] ligase, partial [Candidatus Eremiobacteraeota bacterium]|nr:biotin--[acetyl-CoA-carboxylase] ligase [Candidatus Eremiobacteraeota bacterium]
MTVDTSSTPPPIDARALASAVAQLTRFKSVTCVDSVESTNALALSMLDDDAARGRSILAELQTAGRGRAGRGWISPAGSGVLMSTIVPVELSHETLPALGYWASLCAAEAVIEACSVWPTLKWPNDLMLSAIKVAGVLVEGRTIGSFTRAVIGIGINANRPAEV